MKLPPAAAQRELRELGAFVRFCIGRIERQIGAIERWVVEIGPTTSGGYASKVTATHRGISLDSHGVGHDGTLAAWNALGNIEQGLRELVAHPPIAAAV